MLIRFGKPSKYDQLPYGTICKRISTMGETFEVYIQMGKNDSYPCWEMVGIFTPQTENTIADEVRRIFHIEKVN